MSLLHLILIGIIGGLELGEAEMDFVRKFFKHHPHQSSTSGGESGAMSAGDLKTNPSVKGVASSNAHFSNILHKELEASKPRENVIFSPYSVVSVLAMAKAGAGGNTAQQLSKVLKLPADAELHKGFSLALTSLKEKKDDGYTLSTANRLYGMTGFEIKPDFIKILSESYKSSLEQLDFGQNQAAAATINSWVEKETNSKIKDLISPDALDSMTRIVLVNAVYFKGLWSTQFDPKNTVDGDFYLSANEKIQAPLMKLVNKKLRIGALGDGTQVVSLPYKGDRLTMLVYVNTDSWDGPSPLDSLTLPSKVLDQLGEESVNLVFPKFKLEATISLVEILKKLGLSEMFDTMKADFTGIAEGLYASEVVQKAFIEVNEEGSEAAAATGMVMMMRSLPLPPIDVEINRPFYYQIVDVQTDFVLFQGKVNDPTKSA